MVIGAVDVPLNGKVEESELDHVIVVHNDQPPTVIIMVVVLGIVWSVDEAGGCGYATTAASSQLTHPTGEPKSGDGGIRSEPNKHIVPMRSHNHIPLPLVTEFGEEWGLVCGTTVDLRHQNQRSNMHQQPLFCSNTRQSGRM